MFNMRSALISGAVLAGSAGLLFGGSPVSTAFTAQTSGNVAASAATVAMTPSASIDLALTGLIPGGSATTGSFEVNNTSNTRANLYLTGVSFNPTKNGTTGAPSASDITVTIKDGGSAIWTSPLKNLLGVNKLLAPSIGNGPQTMTVTFTLAQDAGNNWNGASANVPFTLHLQDVSGSDASGFIK